MIEGLEILCFGPGDWWSMNPSCTTHIMRHLAKRNRILYVNPISSDLPSRISRGFARRIVRKSWSTIRSLRRVSRRLHTFSPVFMPYQGHPAIDRLNNMSVRAQIRTVLWILGLKPSLLWLENARAADTLDWYRDLPSVFHVSDSLTDCPYTRNREALRHREERLSRECDLIICVSRSLYEAKRTVRPQGVRYLPHGVDFERFRTAVDQRQQSKHLAGLRHPIAGYFGTLTAQNDIDLLLWCAERAPDIAFVLAGKITGGDYRKLKSLRNVHFPGRIPYDEIPALAAGFDICLLPWRMTDWIKNCSPLKFWEYMASGRTIVSVPIPQLLSEADGLISIAASKEEFLDAIRFELLNDTQERAEQRIRLAAEHRWERHLEKLSAIISDGID